MSDIQTKINPIVYHHIAQVLMYPTSEFQQQLQALQVFIQNNVSDAAPSIDAFQASCAEYSTAQLQELYTRTFDLMALCSPYIGIHLFGEDNYKRGALMAKLNEEYQRRGFLHEAELPDHITVLLRFLTKANEEEKKEIIEFLFSKPLKVMTTILEKEHNPYVHVFRALDNIVQQESTKELVR